MTTKSLRDLAMPAFTSGVLMALYLLARPYGDRGSDADLAAALSSGWWMVAHVAGILALAQFARTALRLADVITGVTARLGRWAALAGLTLVLPYYGAEAFELHVIAQRSSVGGDSLALVDQVRTQPAAMTMFGLGLLLLAVAAVCVAVAWQRATAGRGRWAAWPLAAFVILLLPQFYLPAPGRMAYGVGYALAATLLAVTAWHRPATAEPGDAHQGTTTSAAAAHAG
ncbi:hypothetical protein HJ588_01850 [Flexivirga sp. ID2601S]|uniref:DUF4386 family protein n=1 Tax=Flexivirga aerilata TaxID=1656889 RepID=A0A849AHW7_9MICO|nr:hypothetical protein [Flexivirga aerilata]NNG38020.1 hypothetical protein [Flexivirga aerilata]